jgi:hypothetical protein
MQENIFKDFMCRVEQLAKDNPEEYQKWIDEINSYEKENAE